MLIFKEFTSLIILPTENSGLAKEVIGRLTPEAGTPKYRSNFGASCRQPSEAVQVDGASGVYEKMAERMILSIKGQTTNWNWVQSRSFAGARS